MRLTIHINGDTLPRATNEAVIATTRPARMFAFRILVDGHELDCLRVDGIVFATPTGSTAYAMSAGCPIVDPKVGGIVPLRRTSSRRDRRLAPKIDMPPG